MVEGVRLEPRPRSALIDGRRHHERAAPPPRNRVSRRAPEGVGGRRDGQPHREGCAQHPRHQPAVPGGEDYPHPHIRVQVLEGGVFRPDGGAGGGQSHGAPVRGRGVRRQHQAHALPLPDPEDAADPAREGHHRGVHQKRGLQIRAHAGGSVHEADGHGHRLLQVPGASVQRLPQDQEPEPERGVRADARGRIHRRAAAQRARLRHHPAPATETLRPGGGRTAGGPGQRPGGGHGRRGVQRRGGRGRREAGASPLPGPPPQKLPRPGQAASLPGPALQEEPEPFPETAQPIPQEEKPLPPSGKIPEQEPEAAPQQVPGAAAPIPIQVPRTPSEPPAQEPLEVPRKVQEKPQEESARERVTDGAVPTGGAIRAHGLALRGRCTGLPDSGLTGPALRGGFFTLLLNTLLSPTSSLFPRSRGRELAGPGFGGTGGKGGGGDRTSGGADGPGLGAPRRLAGTPLD